MSVCVLAASLSTQAAYGSEPLSDFTTLLNDYISGSRDSRTSKPYLSLTGVYGCLGSDQTSEGHYQNTIFSGINLLGEVPLCENPLYSGRVVHPHNEILSPNSNLGEAVFQAKEALLQQYLAVGAEFDEIELIRAFESIANAARGRSDALADLIESYVRWFGDRASESSDWSLNTRILGCFVAGTSSVWRTEVGFREKLSQLVFESLLSDGEILNEFCEEGSLDVIGLSCTENLDDLYFLPLRLSAIYGRVGLISLAEKIQKRKILRCKVELIQDLVDKLHPAHVIYNEVQGVQVYLFMLGCWFNEEVSITEIPFGCLLNDHVTSRGLILRDNATSEQVLEYLKLRKDRKLSSECSGLAIPNTVIPAFLLGASISGMEEIVDISLSRWNGKHTNLYLPASFKSFGAPLINAGRNFLVTVGKDFYNSSEYLELLRLEINEGLEFPTTDENSVLLMMLCSHIMPNRLVLPSALFDQG